MKQSKRIPILLYQLILIGIIGLFYFQALSAQIQSDDVKTKELIEQDKQLSQWIPYRKGTDWYFVDKDGEKVLDVSDYEIVHPFSGGLAMIEKEGCYGFIDKTAKLVIPCQLEEPHQVFYFWNNPFYLRIRKMKMIKSEPRDDFSIVGLSDSKTSKRTVTMQATKQTKKKEKLLPYSWMGFDRIKNKLTNYYAFDQINVHPPSQKYRELDRGDKTISDSYIKVIKHEKWGVLNRNSKETIPCTYDDLYILKNEKILVNKKNKYFLINEKNKKVKSYDIDALYPFEKGFIISKNNQFGFLNLEGDISIPIEMDSIFLDSKRYRRSPYLQFAKEDERGWALPNGEVVVPFGFDTCFIDYYSKEITFVKKDDTYFEVTNKEEGVEITETNYTYARKFGDFLIAGINDKMGLYKDSLSLPFEYDTIYLKSIGRDTSSFIFTKKENKWHVFNNNLIDVFNIKADSIFTIFSPYSYQIGAEFIKKHNPRPKIQWNNNARYFIVKNNKWGILGGQGQITIEVEYDQIESLFYHKLFSVKKNNKWGVIDDKGDIIIPIQELDKPFLRGEETNEGFFIKLNSKDGLQCFYMKKEFTEPIKLKEHGVRLSQKRINNDKWRRNFFAIITSEIPNNKECTCESSLNISDDLQLDYTNEDISYTAWRVTNSKLPNDLQLITRTVQSELYTPTPLSMADSLLFKQHQLSIRKPDTELDKKIQIFLYEKYIPSTFDDLIDLGSCYAFIKKENKWGVYNRCKKYLIIQPIFDQLLFDKAGWMPMDETVDIPRYGKIDGVWWILNKCGDPHKMYKPSEKKSPKDVILAALIDSSMQVIANSLSETIVYNNNTILLKKGNAWHLFDPINYTLTEISNHTNFKFINNETPIVAKTKDGWYLLNQNLDKMHTTPYDTLLYNKKNKLIYVKKDNKTGVFYEGKEVLAPICEDAKIDGQFIIAKNKTIYATNKYLYVYDEIKMSHNGLLLVKEEERYGFMRQDGTTFFENN